MRILPDDLGKQKYNIYVLFCSTTNIASFLDMSFSPGPGYFRKTCTNEPRLLSVVVFGAVHALSPDDAALQ